MFTEMNDLHENWSDLAKNFSTLLRIFFYSNKNKCSMASGSRWDDYETGAEQDIVEKQCEWAPG